MRARIAGFAVLFMAIALVPAVPAEAAKRRAKPCAAKGSKTVRNTRDVRIWSRKKTDESNVQTQYFGCLKSVKRQVFLTSTDGDGGGGMGGSGPTALKVAGRYVAFVTVADSGCSRYMMCEPANPDGVSAGVTAFDLRRRKRVRGIGPLPDPPTAFALTQRGGLAVLANGNLVGVDAGGQRQLDAGAIDGRTLRAEISIVSWVRDGVERFARLR